MNKIEALQPVDAVMPAAGYIGGKKNLFKRILPCIDGQPHRTYAEPFVGMGGVFFRRQFKPKSEVINDRSGDVATFFRILQRHYTPFVEMLRYQVTGRQEFERLVSVDPETLTDLERAARFLYLQRTGFGGKVQSRTFGVDVRGGARFDVTTVVPTLQALHDRLTGVVIEKLDWSDFIRRYDRPETLFYLDPPYWGSEKDYGPGFDRADFTRLSDQLRGLQGRFVLSLNDVPEVRELFDWATIKAVRTTYTLHRGASKKVGELIIRSPE